MRFEVQPSLTSATDSAGSRLAPPGLQDLIVRIKAVNDSNAVASVEDIAGLLTGGSALSGDGEVVVRHLAALAFRFDGSEKRDLAARVYDLAAAVSPRDARRWRLAAAEVRFAELHDLCADRRFDAASEVAARLTSTDTAGAMPKFVAAISDLGWYFELRHDAGACLQCYRLALELNGGGSAVITPDGQGLATKIKNLRRLELDALVEEGRFERAIALHAETRHLIGSGPLAVYDIVAARDLDGSPDAAYVELLPPRPIAAPVLKFSVPPPPLESEPGDLTAPPQYLALIERCRAFPRSNIVITGNRLVYDLAAHPRRGDILLQDGVNPDQIMMAAFGATRALVEEPTECLRIEAGLSLFGLQSRNYGHWFCEFVPRMLVYNDPRCPDGIPLCIDDHMPATHEEVVALLDERARPIIKLPSQAVEFGLLGLAPVPAFFPFEMRPGQRVYDTIWPADILVALRTRILKRARERGALSGRTGRRLFISRKAFAQRQLVNEAEIANVLRPHGFEVVTPETMTFLEQVDAFHSADLVVGSSSSALTNGLFCRPDCHILGLIHGNLGFNFRGYTSFIEAGGAQITFLRGHTLNEEGHAFHANYTVPPSDIVAAIGSLQPPTPAPSRSSPSARPSRSILGRMIGALPFTSRGEP